MTWVPEHEVYCPGCTRMVAAQKRGDVLAPEVHFRYTAEPQSYEGTVSWTSRRHAERCRGPWRPTGVSHGMEDPDAAFWHLPAYAHGAYWGYTTMVSQKGFRLWDVSPS